MPEQIYKKKIKLIIIKEYLNFHSKILFTRPHFSILNNAELKINFYFYFILKSYLVNLDSACLIMLNWKINKHFIFYLLKWCHVIWNCSKKKKGLSLH